MAVQTIAGLFTNAARGESVLAELKKAGFSSAQISELADDHDPEPKKLSNPISDFFKDHTTTGNEFQSNLSDLGISSEDSKYFEDGVARGGALVTVKGDDRSSEAVAILQRGGADLGSMGRGERSAATGSVPMAAGVRDDRDTRDESDERAVDEQKMQLRAERLSVDKTRVASGTVRIGKRVVSEQQSVDVPVSHDELVIERHKLDDGAVGGAIGDSKTISVPLSRDEVRVGKETYATEEVEIGKRAVGGTERVLETVRHEELVVDGDDKLKRDSRV